MIAFPDKRYEIIYADPPWQSGGKHYSALAPDRHYPCMQPKEIAKIPVWEIADDNCLLFLWAISPALDGAIDVGKAWGFQYITVGFFWNKQYTLPSFYTLSQVEQCLIFKRRKIPDPRGKRDIRQLLETNGEFVSIKRGKHSVKPKQIRDRITEMFPEQEKIELFARPDWTDYGRGWDFWGNEV